MNNVHKTSQRTFAQRLAEHETLYTFTLRHIFQQAHSLFELTLPTFNINWKNFFTEMSVHYTRYILLVKNHTQNACIIKPITHMPLGF